MKTYGNISTIQAEALILLQSLIYGFGDPISKIAFEVTPVYAMMTARYLIALAGSMMFESGIHLETTTPQAWGIILYLALMCTFLGYLLQNLALMKISDRSVALIQSLCPVMTAAFSFLLLGEALSPAGIAGAGIIVVCVALASAIKS